MISSGVKTVFGVSMGCESVKQLVAKALLLLGLLVAESACTLSVSGTAMQGRVVDEATGNPIQGALVIAQWSGDVGGPVQSSQTCFHLEIATTDADGRYRIPGWSRRPVADWEGGFFGLRNIEVTRRTYKDGYAQLRYDPRDSRTILMTPFRGTPDERIDYLSRQGTPGCGREDGSLTQELLLWSAICTEARQIPAAREQHANFGNGSFLREIDFHIDSAASGSSRRKYVPDRSVAPACSER